MKTRHFGQPYNLFSEGGNIGTDKYLRGMIRIAVLASGTGSNALNLIKYFKGSDTGRVVLVASNKKSAPVIVKAKSENIETYFIDVNEKSGEHLLSKFSNSNINFIVLAGYLKLIPSLITKKYKGRIINIHPSLLPKHGGKGMYGKKVHQSVLESNDSKSGITIHYVNELFDEGEIIKQVEIDVLAGDTANDLSNRIRKLEHKYFPLVIENLIKKLPNSS